MKVIFRTLPAPASARLPDDSTALGALHFEAKAFTVGEEGSVWPNGRPPAPASEWLRQGNAQGAIVVPPPAKFHPGVPAVVIPAAVLRGVPADALIAMEWWWEATP